MRWADDGGAGAPITAMAGSGRNDARP